MIISKRFEDFHEVLKIIFRCYNNKHLAINFTIVFVHMSNDVQPKLLKTKMIIALPARRWNPRYRRERKDLFVDIDNASYSD